MLRFVTVRCVNVNSTEALLRVLVAACVCRGPARDAGLAAFWCGVACRCFGIKAWGLPVPRRRAEPARAGPANGTEATLDGTRILTSVPLPVHMDAGGVHDRGCDLRPLVTKGKRVVLQHLSVLASCIQAHTTTPGAGCRGVPMSVPLMTLACHGGTVGDATRDNGDN